MQNHSRSLVPQFLEEHGWDQCDRDRDAKQDYDDPDEPYLRRVIVAREFEILVLAVALRVFLTAHSITFRFRFLDAGHSDFCIIPSSGALYDNFCLFDLLLLRYNECKYHSHNEKENEYEFTYSTFIITSERQITWRALQ
jgi:hypothetical protein